MAPLAGQAVDVQDGGVCVNLANPVGKDLALCLRDDVPLGDDHHVGHFQHRSYFLWGVDSAQVVDYADSQHTLNMRGAAVAKPGALNYQQVEAFLCAPGEAVTGVADEEVVGTKIARQTGRDHHSLL